jgi:hypothetical protein
MKKSLSQLEYEAWVLRVRLDRLLLSLEHKPEYNRIYCALTRSHKRWLRRLATLNNNWIDETYEVLPALDDSNFDYCPY